MGTGRSHGDRRLRAPGSQCFDSKSTDKETILPVSGSVFLFAPDTAVEELKLPAGFCEITEKRLIDVEKKDHQIKLSIQDHEAKGKFRIKAFQDGAKVYLKVANS